MMTARQIARRNIVLSLIGSTKSPWWHEYIERIRIRPLADDRPEAW